MLENIKSVYFIKILFSHVFERNKLQIIKYNKNLQNKIDITLLNYKIYSGKYIIYGKRNGKGKEYDGEGNLIFEGKFKNGIKYNKIKKKIISEIKNGKGNIKEYNEYGILIFEGEYLKEKNYLVLKYLVLLEIYLVKIQMKKKKN